MQTAPRGGEVFHVSVADDERHAATPPTELHAPRGSGTAPGDVTAGQVWPAGAG